MNLYISSDNDKLNKLQVKPFVLEKDLQRLFEDNLTEITGLELVKSEFEIKNKRIDTLAFDNASNAFVIIEYKRNNHYSVVDQSIAYLSLLLEYNAEFINEYYERLNKRLRKNKIKWQNSTVMFVSQEFSDNQIQAADFMYFPVALWKVKRFENGTIMFNEVLKNTPVNYTKPIFRNVFPGGNNSNWHNMPLWTQIRILANS